jgi:class 3 adenylate cyclase
MDIHGYTRFCQKHRHNMSMLDLLDRVIQQDIPAIAAKFGIVSKRARGDEILLLGGSASELFEVVYLIARRLAKDTSAPKPNPLAESSAAAPSAASLKPPIAAKSIHAPKGAKVLKEAPAPKEVAPLPEPKAPVAVDGLPGFQISAGVAGGAKYAQLVITRDGDLSGTIVNTAARLQARANRISPDRTKILLTSITFQKLKMQPSSKNFEFLKAVDFFDTGMVEFKGINVPVFDTVFLDKEASRLEYRERMGALYDSIGQGMWTSRIFSDALSLMARIVISSTGRLTDEETGEPLEAPDGIMQSIKKAQTFFDVERYEQAVEELNRLIDIFCRASGHDPIVVEYLTAVRDNYHKLLVRFTEHLDREIDEHLETIFLGANDRANYRTLEKHHLMFRNVRDAARIKVADRRSIWHRVADESSKALGVRIQSKK